MERCAPSTPPRDAARYAESPGSVFPFRPKKGSVARVAGCQGTDCELVGAATPGGGLCTTSARKKATMESRWRRVHIERMGDTGSFPTTTRGLDYSSMRWPSRSRPSRPAMGCILINRAHVLYALPGGLIHGGSARSFLDVMLLRARRSLYLLPDEPVTLARTASRRKVSSSRFTISAHLCHDWSTVAPPEARDKIDQQSETGVRLRRGEMASVRVQESVPEGDADRGHLRCSPAGHRRRRDAGGQSPGPRRRQASAATSASRSYADRPFPGRGGSSWRQAKAPRHSVIARRADGGPSRILAGATSRAIRGRREFPGRRAEARPSCCAPSWSRAGSDSGILGSASRRCSGPTARIKRQLAPASA